MIVPKWTAILAIVLSGCSAIGPVDSQLSLSSGSGRSGTHRAAIASTANAFVNGDRHAAPNPSAFGGDFNAIDAGLFDVGNTTAYTRTADASLAVAHQATSQLAGPWAAYRRVTLAAGKTTYFLPRGMGVFTDPTHLEFTGVTLEPEVGVQRSWQGRGRGQRYTLTGAAGIGLQATAGHTSVQSALLDVNHASSHAIPYAVTGVTLADRKSPLTSGLNARLYRDGAVQVRAELALPLRSY